MNCPGGMYVDHIDGNKLNNRRSNLRICTNQENCMNRKKCNNNLAGYKGVHFRKDLNKFHAQIAFNGKKIYLGIFKTAEEAHQKYCEEGRKLFGEYFNSGEVV